MTTYTEFNTNMFLCNNFDNSNNNVYSKGNTILSTPSSLSKATFYNLTEIKKLNNGLTDNDKVLLDKFIDPEPSRASSSSPPYDISYTLYNYLLQYRKTYNEYLLARPPANSHEWVYTFGQLVHSDISTNLSADNTKEEITYTPIYSSYLG